MNLDPLQMFWGVGAGAVMGGLYFGALWMTVARLARVSRPGQFWAASFVLRLSLLLLAFYGLVSWGWVVMASAMAGFLAARQAWLRFKGARPTVV